MLTIKRLDLAEAEAMIAAAKAKAEEIGVPTCIAVTDESGKLISFARMNGAKISSIELALDKAFTAAGTRKGTHLLQEVCQPGKPAYGLANSAGGRIMVLGGGLPVMCGDDVIGAIGVSTGSPTQDIETAEAGVQAYLDLA